MTLRTAIRLILLSLVVGMVLSLIGITPVDFWGSAVNLAEDIGRALVRFAEWAFIYILIGAAIVFPVYFLHRFITRKRPGPGNGKT